MNNEIEEALGCAIDRVNELLPVGAGLSGQSGTILLGEGGRLDSMGFVNLLVALEEELDSRFGVKADMADELMTLEGTLTVGDLFSVISRLVRTNRATGALDT